MEINMIYGYLRVSTDKQSLKNQEYEIKNFCTKKNIAISFWIKETISGSINLEHRKLSRILKALKKGDILICSEISRLGRNLFQIMSILNICMQKEVQVWTIKDNYRLGTDIQSKVLAFAFSLSAEIERTLISQRTKEALARIKSDGKKLGRPFGSKNKKYILDNKTEAIHQMLLDGISKKQIAKKLSISIKSLYNYLKTEQ